MSCSSLFDPAGNHLQRTARFAVACVCVFAPLFLFANDCNTGGQAGVLRALSATTLGKAGIDIGAVCKYSTDDDYVTGPSGTGEVVNLSNGMSVSRTAPQLLSGNIFAAFGLNRFWDFSVDFPVYQDLSGWGVSRAGMGDVEFATKLAYPFALPNAFLSQAYYLNVMVPTGDKQCGFFPRQTYYIRSDANSSGVDAFSTGAVFYNPMLLWTFDFSRLSPMLQLWFHINFGGVIAKEKSGSAVTAALALEYAPSTVITLFVELSGESRVKYYTESFSTDSFDKDPLRFSPGFRLNLPKGLYCVLSGDAGLSDRRPQYRAKWNSGGYGYSTKALPAWSGQFCLGWSHVRKKAIAGTVGPAPKSAAVAARPDTVITSAPQPMTSADNFPDRYAPRDKDQDGVPDSIDKCPEAAGPASNGGCPSPITAASSAASTFPVPVAQEPLRKPLVLGAIHFETGESALSESSLAILAEVAESLNEWPEATVEIQGYSDQMGAEGTNLRLSQLRAQSVLAYLITKGVSSARLRAVGYGSVRPVATNKSAAGRRKNRRVELHRVDE